MGTLNNTKVVMSQNDSITLTDFAGWDIIPSGVNPGFFTILNQRYIGQDGSSDFGSLYRYAIEASTNNTLRFAKPEEGKAQQEFQILPVDSNVKFVLDSIEYNISSARIISKGIIEKDGYGENLAYESKSVDVEFNFEVKEESRFEEKYGNIFPLIVEYGSYQRPYILGDNVRKPKSNTPKDAPYKNFPTSVIRKRIIYKEGLILDARTLVDLRLRFHYCNVAVDYIARSRYVGNDKIEREMIFTGTWHGLLYQDPTVVKPEVVSKKISILPGGSTGGDMELRVKNDKLY